MKRFLLFAITCISLSVSAQDLTGVWRGNFRATNKSRLMEMLGQDERYKFEVQVDQRGKAFSGVTYSYLSTVFYGKATCEGTVSPSTHKVRLEEIKLVEQRMSGGGEVCIMTLYLQYSKVGDEEFLEGTYTSVKTSDTTDCGKGTVFLRKVTTSDFYKEPFLVEREKQAELKKNNPTPTPKTDSAIVKKAAPVVKPATPKTAVVTKPPVKTTTPVKKPATPPANTTAQKTTPKPPVSKPPVTTKPPVANPPVAKTEIKPTTPVIVDTPKRVEKPVVTVAPASIPKILQTRENELVRTIVTSARQLEIKIYDNGSVDNDTISVYVDKKLVLSKKRLTERAIVMTVDLSEEIDYHELVMVAENLGEIPPNTSLMIINAGKEQYEVRITSTEQKNAVIVFRYDKNAK